MAGRMFRRKAAYIVVIVGGYFLGCFISVILKDIGRRGLYEENGHENLLTILSSTSTQQNLQGTKQKAYFENTPQVEHPFTFAKVEFIGRLGNQLFEYATLLGLAHKLGCQPVTPPSPKNSLLETFDIPFVRNISVNNSRVFDGDCCYYKRFPESKGSFNWTVRNYCQSWRYFENVTQLLRYSLRFREQVLSQANEFLQQYKQLNSPVVGIHIRRGDYLDPSLKERGRTTGGIDYINRAQQFFRDQFSNVQFIVLSDDHDWCLANINGSDVTHSHFKVPGVDMALMSLCDHMIITGGTFGWWGAWLANGITVYNKNFPRPGSVLDKLHVRKDYYPHYWIGMV